MPIVSGGRPGTGRLERPGGRLEIRHTGGGRAGRRAFPDVEIWTHEGRKVRFYDDS
jgi:hypothetical protein